MTIILFISFLEVNLNMSKNISSNQNRTNDAPYLYNNLIREVINDLLMTMTVKLLEQNLIKITNNKKLAEKFMFHIQVSNVYSKILYMQVIYF